MAATTGENIAALRNRKKWTQTRLATKAKVCRGTIALWEGGGRMPRHKNLQKLAALFGVGVRDIVGERA